MYSKEYDWGTIIYDIAPGKQAYVWKVKNKPGETAEEVEFPDNIKGNMITDVKTNAFSDFKCKRLIFSHYMFLAGEAFENAPIEEIHFSKAKGIPWNCFKGSKLRKITGLDNVENIASGAFAMTPCLEELTWPSNCHDIPKACFEGSGIKFLYTEKQELGVYMSAFAGCKNVNVSGCEIIRVREDVKNPNEFWENFMSFDSLILRS